MKKLGISIDNEFEGELVFEGKDQKAILKELQNEKYLDKDISLWYYNGEYWDFC